MQLNLPGTENCPSHTTGSALDDSWLVLMPFNVNLLPFVFYFHY